MSSIAWRGMAWLAMTGSLAFNPVALMAADKVQVDQAIAKGAAHIRGTLGNIEGGAKSLAYITLLKVGEPHESPLMIQAVEHIRKHITDGAYQRPPEHIYEAAIHIMLLVDLDSAKYKQEIQLIADYIQQQQLPNGAWTYPQQDPKCVNGDCSITHYACLGLWAARRAGVKVDHQVWVRVLNWQSQAHNADGGFAYWPGSTIGDGAGNSTLNMTVNSVGTGLIAIMNLDPKRVPKFDTGGPGAGGTTPSKKDPGVLEAVNLDTKADIASGDAAMELAGTGRVPESAFATVKNAYAWVTPRFDSVNRTGFSKAYYYYSLERMAALANVTKIGNRDWYNECADYLLTAQNADGSWAMTTLGGTQNDTCFAVLFLTRSTGKILKRTNLEPPVGGGLLSGGRGLPDDLKELDASGNVKKKKEKSSLDELLASLQNANADDLDEAQAEIVQQIQLGDRKDLIGKKDMLLKLVESPDPDVRKTAIWAIGRTGDLSLARFALRGLDDPNQSVMLESHMALCWTARKPNAFNFPLDPLEELAANAGPDQQSAAVELWRRQALRKWGDWYLRNRPYSERGDEFETNLRNRLLELK